MASSSLGWGAWSREAAWLEELEELELDASVLVVVVVVVSRGVAVEGVGRDPDPVGRPRRASSRSSTFIERGADARVVRGRAPRICAALRGR